MKTTKLLLAALLALVVAPTAVPAEPPQAVVGRSSFARCYKFAVRQAAKIERIRARSAAQACDGKSLAQAASQANLSTNRVIRLINERVAGFAGSGPAACDPDLFDGSPLPPFPIPEESPAETTEGLQARLSECDGAGEQPPPE